MWSTGRSACRARSIVFLPSRSSIASSIEGHGRRFDTRGSETRAGLRGVASSDCVGAHNFVRGRLDNDNVEGSACRNESRDHFLRFAPCARGILGENITLSAPLHFFSTSASDTICLHSSFLRHLGDLPLLTKGGLFRESVVPAIHPPPVLTSKLFSLFTKSSEGGRTDRLHEPRLPPASRIFPRRRRKYIDHRPRARRRPPLPSSPLFLV